MNATTTHRGWIIAPVAIGYDIQHPDYDRDNEIDWRHGHADTVEGARVEIDRLLAEDAEWTEAASILKTGVTAPSSEPAIAEGERWTFTPDERERSAILDLCADQDLSPKAVMRQALRLYQSDHLRRKAGETVVWSGDDQRARDFAGPLATTPPTTNDAIPAGMVRWDGGRKPDDWSGEAVQFRSGEVMHAPPAGTIWKLGWDHCYGSGDIIAYTPKASAETDPDEPLYRKLGQITDEQRADIRRIMTGEADEDRIRRGDVHEAVRSLRTNPVPSREYQRALGDVGKLVTALSAAPSAPATEAGEEA